jgi:hypothetical protein
MPHYSSCRRLAPPSAPLPRSPPSAQTQPCQTASTRSPTTSTCWPPRSRKAGCWTRRRLATSPRPFSVGSSSPRSFLRQHRTPN